LNAQVQAKAGSENVERYISERLPTLIDRSTHFSGRMVLLFAQLTTFVSEDDFEGVFYLLEYLKIDTYGDKDEEKKSRRVKKLTLDNKFIDLVDFIFQNLNTDSQNVLETQSMKTLFRLIISYTYDCSEFAAYVNKSTTKSLLSVLIQSLVFSEKPLVMADAQRLLFNLTFDEHNFAVFLGESETFVNYVKQGQIIFQDGNRIHMRADFLGLVCKVTRYGKVTLPVWKEIF